MDAQTILDRYCAEAGNVVMKPSEARALINYTVLQMQAGSHHEEEKKPVKHRTKK